MPSASLAALLRLGRSISDSCCGRLRSGYLQRGGPLFESIATAAALELWRARGRPAGPAWCPMLLYYMCALSVRTRRRRAVWPARVGRHDVRFGLGCSDSKRRASDRLPLASMRLPVLPENANRNRLFPSASKTPIFRSALRALETRSRGSNWYYGESRLPQLWPFAAPGCCVPRRRAFIVHRAVSSLH